MSSPIDSAAAVQLPGRSAVWHLCTGPCTWPRRLTAVKRKAATLVAARARIAAAGGGGSRVIPGNTYVTAAQGGARLANALLEAFLANRGEELLCIGVIHLRLELVHVLACVHVSHAGVPPPSDAADPAAVRTYAATFRCSRCRPLRRSGAGLARSRGPLYAARRCAATTAWASPGRPGVRVLPPPRLTSAAARA
eukprot:scaffold1085_cov407-Prasinococcus_capsulatus_cf.AAC.7